VQLVQLVKQVQQALLDQQVLVELLDIMVHFMIQQYKQILVQLVPLRFT
jgi:hypothetical protein